MRKIIQLLVVFLLLVVFPLGSWYYLKMGMGYRIGHLEELKELGPLPLPNMPDAELGVPLPADSMNGKWIVSGFVDLANTQQAKLMGTTLSELHMQFKERKDLVLLTFVQGDSLAFDNWATQFKLYGLNQCRFALGNASQVQSTVAQYGIAGSDWQNHTWMVFSDNKQMIRRKYSVDQEVELKKLVEHIAILLPTSSRDEPVLKREKEK